MKIIAGLSIAVYGVEVDRSVPPRHPKNRLARLQSFCQGLTTASWVKKERFVKLGDRCEGWMNARLNAFEKCGFYDSSVRHGGPDPNVEYKLPHNIYWGEEKEKLDLFDRRKRRSAEDCTNWDGDMTGISYFMFNDEFEHEIVRVQNDNPCAPDYIDSAWLDIDNYAQAIQEERDEECNDDCESDADKSCEKKCKETSRSLELTPKRIENRGPWKSARSIVTGMRKWGQRYLAECPGHRNGRHMLRRHNFMKTCARKFTDQNLCFHEDCTEQYANRFNWGGHNMRLENPYLN